MWVNFGLAFKAALETVLAHTWQLCSWSPVRLFEEFVMLLGVVTAESSYSKSLRNISGGAGFKSIASFARAYKT